MSRVDGTTAATHNVGANIYLVSDARGAVLAAGGGTPAVSMGAYNGTVVEEAANLSVQSEPTGTTAGGTLSSVSVKAVDASGNPVAGVTVTVGISNRGRLAERHTHGHDQFFRRGDIR